MSDFLKNHPFAVEAHFEKSIVLSFAFPKHKLEAFIPECLQLDTFNDEWAFIAVALVQTKNLRPKGFPNYMGQDFFLIGYRVFVRYDNLQGRRLRGLYILKSETDKKRMETAGNIFTHYNYTSTDIHLLDINDEIKVTSQQSGLKVAVQKSHSQVPLPAGSPFKDWKEARRFAGPLPFTFTFNAKTREVLIVEGVRENWKPQPLIVNHQEVSFLKNLGFGEAKLANAFIVENIPYYWKKGKVEKWKI